MVYFLIPVFNEEGNIEELARNLTSVLPNEKKHYVIVNDSSTDRTCEFVNRYFANTQLTLLSNNKNSGPGFSFNEGFNFILTNSKNDNDLIVTLEGDNTSDLSILPLMISLANDWKFDLVLSSVYAQGGGFVRTSFVRKFISFVANLMLRSLFNISILTLSSFYRVYRIGLIKEMAKANSVVVSEKGFICAFEVLLKAIHLKAKMIEVPMVLRSDKRQGKSKMKIMKTSFTYITFLFRYKFA